MFSIMVKATNLNLFGLSMFTEECCFIVFPSLVVSSLTISSMGKAHGHCEVTLKLPTFLNIKTLNYHNYFKLLFKTCSDAFSCLVSQALLEATFNWKWRSGSSLMESNQKMNPFINFFFLLFSFIKILYRDFFDVWNLVKANNGRLRVPFMKIKIISFFFDSMSIVIWRMKVTRDFFWWTLRRSIDALRLLT